MLRKALCFAGAASLLFATGALAQVNPNGSFETVADPSYTPPAGGFSTLYAGTNSATAIQGWTVTQGSVDWIDSGFWQSADGHYSLDMDGANPGTIAQTFATVAGTTYNVLFSLSKNYGAASAILGVNAGEGSNDGMFSFDKSNTNTDMMWTPENYSFTANGPSTTLTFTALSGTDQGPALDNVRVTAAGASAVPEPATWAMMLLGFGMVGAGLRYRRKSTTAAFV